MSALPKGWTQEPLAKLGTWTGGGTPSTTNADFWTNGSIPWVSPKDMKQRRITTAQDSITEAAVRASTTNLIPENSVMLVTRSGILRHSLPVATNTQPVTLNQDMKALTPLEALLLDYLYYAFRRYERDILHGCCKGGTTVQSIEAPRLMAFEIPIAPLAEQRRIVGKVEELFSELDEGVANLKLARAQLAVYRQALLKHAFEGHLTADWRTKHAPELESADQLVARIRAERDQAFEAEVEQWKEAVAQWDSSEDGERSPPKPQKLKPVHRDQRPSASAKTPESWPVFHLDEIVISIGQGWSPKCEGFPAEDSHWGVMKTTAIQPLEFRGYENKQLPDGLHPRPWLQILQNDILITRAGPRSRCGIVCRVKDSPGKVMLCDKAYRLRLPESIVSSGYMELLLNSTDSSNRIEALKTGINDSGVNITQSGFLNLAFPVPPISEQMEIQRRLAESLSVIDHIEADIDLNLQKAEALRQSILKKAFAGELVPQDPSDEPAAALLARIRAEREAATARPKAKQAGKRPAKLT